MNTQMVVQVTDQEQTEKLLAVKKVLTRLSEIETMTQAMKGLYDEKEKLTLELLNLVGPNQELVEGDMIFSVVDNFATKNVVFRPAAVRRYDLDIDSVFARQQKANKEAEKLAKKQVKDDGKV